MDQPARSVNGIDGRPEAAAVGVVAALGRPSRDPHR